MDLKKTTSHKIVFLLLLALTCVVYINSFTGDFVFDDYHLIVNNAYVQRLSAIPLLFKTSLFQFSSLSSLSYPYYRPMQSSAYALLYHVSGLHTVGYHIANILIHAFNAFLLFYLIQKLFAQFPLALLSSLLFCVHPIQTETVSYISCLAELQAAMFILLSAAAYIQYAQKSKGLLYVFSMICYVCAILSRETGFLLLMPFIMLAIAFKYKISRGRAVSHFAAFAGIISIYLLLRFTILVPIVVVPATRLPPLLTALNFGKVLLQYASLLVFPYDLHLLRTFPPLLSLRPIHLLAFAVFLVLLLLLIKRKKYIPLFGLAWYFLMLLHVAVFMNKFYEQGYIAMEEHWVYLASAGFFVAIAYPVVSIRSPMLKKAISFSLLGAYSFLTVVNSLHWNRELEFYRYNLKFKNSSMTFLTELSYTGVLAAKGFYRKALDRADYSILVSPANWLAHVSRGDILRGMKKFEDAKESYLNALKIDFFCWQAYQRLQTLSRETGEPFEAQKYPGFSPGEASVITLIREGEFKKALEELRPLLARSPDARLYSIAGILLGKMGMYGRAIDAFTAALRLDPYNGLALRNLEVTYELSGQTPGRDKKIKELLKKFIPGMEASPGLPAKK